MLFIASHNKDFKPHPLIKFNSLGKTIMKMAKNFTLIAALTLAFASLRAPKKRHPLRKQNQTTKSAITLPLSATTAIAAYRKPEKSRPYRAARIT